MAEIDRLAATLAFDEPVGRVAQVSAGRARALAKLGIETVRDLLAHYPHRYIDMSTVATVASAHLGDMCTIVGDVYEVEERTTRKARVSLTKITVVDGTGALIVSAFRQPWLAKSVVAGARVSVAGKLEFYNGFKCMTNPDIAVMDPDAPADVGRVKPVHGLAGNLKAGMMQRIIANGLALTCGAIDPLPLHLRAKYRLMSRNSALNCIHFPHSMDEQAQARRRLAYEEVLLLELMLMQQARERERGREPVSHVIDGPCKAALADAVPFELTDEQARARDEILAKLADSHAANHMLLGDVGTGKTVVSAFALAAVADTGGQAAFMAPTEILARQHAASLGPLLERAGITWDVLTGSSSAEERKGVLERVAGGQTCVLFGTHALLEKDVTFARCTLAVIDEQQRFGVEQRQALLAKGDCPDALYLTATPIPRTLALALFGNLTLSYIRKRPRATAPRATYVHHYAERGRAYDAAREALARGEQVYVVCPLVGEKRGSEGDDAQREGDGDDYAFSAICIEDENDMSGGNVAAAEDQAAFLAAKVFTDSEVGLVHGKLSSAEKHDVMERFRAGSVNVLVATTVIEVGVDVPNATVMIVEDADRFGLAQLHQLRGRVGRGSLPGEVHLVSGTRDEASLARLAAMERTDDGFELAEYDLSLRREGDILGNRQHGASMLKLVNVVRDQGIVEAAHTDAAAILADDPNMETEQYRSLSREARMAFRAHGSAVGG